MTEAHDPMPTSAELRDEMRAELRRLREERDRLRAALRALYDEQNGPPMEWRKLEWQAAMEAASRELEPA